jgi:hypothetical protein
MVRIGLLGLLLGLVAGAGSSARTNGPTHDRARRAGNRTADGGTAEGARSATDAGSGFLVTLRGLTGHRAARRSQGSADGCADGTADNAADYGSAHSTRGAADGLAGMLLVVRRGAFAKVRIVEIVSLVVSDLVVHVMTPLVLARFERIAALASQ